MKTSNPTLNSITRTASMKMINRLKGFDWYHEMSDDMSVWDRGTREREGIVKELSLLCPKEKQTLVRHLRDSAWFAQIEPFAKVWVCRELGMICPNTPAYLQA